MTEHLIANIAGFDASAGQRLTDAMNRAFPFAEVEPSPEHWRPLDDIQLPDEDDRHVLAAALTAEATVLCTSTVKDFPTDVIETLGIQVLTPDQLLSQLIDEYEPQMLAAPHEAVASLNGATNASTIAAVRKAGALATAELMARLLGAE